MIPTTRNQSPYPQRGDRRGAPTGCPTRRASNRLLRFYLSELNRRKPIQLELFSSKEVAA